MHVINSQNKSYQNNSLSFGAQNFIHNNTKPSKFLHFGMVRGGGVLVGFALSLSLPTALWEYLADDVFCNPKSNKIF